MAPGWFSAAARLQADLLHEAPDSLHHVPTGNTPHASPTTDSSPISVTFPKGKPQEGLAEPPTGNCRITTTFWKSRFPEGTHSELSTTEHMKERGTHTGTTGSHHIPSFRKCLWSNYCVGSGDRYIGECGWHSPCPHGGGEGADYITSQYVTNNITAEIVNFPKEIVKVRKKRQIETALH